MDVPSKEKFINIISRSLKLQAREMLPWFAFEKLFPPSLGYGGWMNGGSSIVGTIRPRLFTELF
jgi:hypothetical protein